MEPPPMQVDPNTTEHSLPNAEEARTEQAISSSGSPAKNKRWLLPLVSLVLISALIIGVSVGIAGRNSKSKTSSPADVPDSVENDDDPRIDEVKEFLTFLTPKEVLNEEGSPQNKAAKWIADEDTFRLKIPESTNYDDSFHFFQRYILAVFYHALDGPNWDHRLHFLTETPVCKWNYELKSKEDNKGEGENDWILGIQCNDDGEVEHIFMPGLGLKGELPPEIGLLIAVKHFSVFENSISGTFPEQIQFMTSLEFLALESNLFSGEIPAWFSLLTSLEYLALGDNQFSGNLPDFSKMKSLKQVALDSNSFTGPIDVFNGASSLESLFLQNNMLTGVVDDAFLAGAPMKELDISNNQISGTFLPDFYTYEIVSLHSNSMSGELPEVEIQDSPLTFLSIFENGFSGAIPLSIGELSKLTHLDVSMNSFTGDFPYTVNNLRSLVHLFLSYNDFNEGEFPQIWELENLKELSLKSTNRVGVIPEYVGLRLTQLKLLDLHDNGFTGEIPETIGNLNNMAFLLLNRNKLSGNIPDSFSNLKKLVLFMVDKNGVKGDAAPICVDNGLPPNLQMMTADCPDEVTCECCDICCKDSEEECNGLELMANIDEGYTREDYVFSENLIFHLSGDPKDSV